MGLRSSALCFRTLCVALCAALCPLDHGPQKIQGSRNSPGHVGKGGTQRSVVALSEVWSELNQHQAGLSLQPKVFRLSVYLGVALACGNLPSASSSLPWNVGVHASLSMAPTHQPCDDGLAERWRTDLTSCTSN